MTAQIISLADFRRSVSGGIRQKHESCIAEAARRLGPNSEEFTLFLLRNLARKLGLPPLKPSDSALRPTSLESIPQIADELRIDVEAPFRAKPKERPFVVPVKPGDRKPPKPRKGGAK